MSLYIVIYEYIFIIGYFIAFMLLIFFCCLVANKNDSESVVPQSSPLSNHEHQGSSSVMPTSNEYEEMADVGSIGK